MKISSTLLASRAVPAVTKFQPLADGPSADGRPASPARRMFPRHLHALDVGAVNEVLELADELDDRDALPFHVRAVEVEADDAFVARLAHVVDVVAGRFDVAHGPFARMAFEVEGDAVFLQRSQTGPKRSTSSSRLTSRTSGIACPPIAVGSGGNRNQWLQQWAGEPTKPGSATLRSCSLLKCPAKRTHASRSRCASLVDQLADFIGDEIRIGARRLVALVAPGLVGEPGFALAAAEIAASWRSAHRREPALADAWPR